MKSILIRCSLDKFKFVLECRSICLATISNFLHHKLYKNANNATFVYFERNGIGGELIFSQLDQDLNCYVTLQRERLCLSVMGNDDI